MLSITDTIWERTKLASSPGHPMFCVLHWNSKRPRSLFQRFPILCICSRDNRQCPGWRVYFSEVLVREVSLCHLVHDFYKGILAGRGGGGWSERRVCFPPPPPPSPPFQIKTLVTDKSPVQISIIVIIAQNSHVHPNYIVSTFSLVLCR